MAAYFVSIGQLLCLAFLWCFLNKISLDWLLTLTTQPSTSKLSDNPVQCRCNCWILLIIHVIAYTCTWHLESDSPDFWHRNNPSISECKVTYSALYWPVMTSSTKLPPRGQLATMTNSTQLGLHVDEILDNNPSLCIHLTSSWFICLGYLTYSHSSRGSTAKKLQHSLANPASYAGYTVGGELLGSESTFWWQIKRQSVP